MLWVSIGGLLPGGASCKEPICQCRRCKRRRQVQSLGREDPLEEGMEYGNLLQYSCLDNPMDRGAWSATVHGVAKIQTWLKWLSTHVCMQVSVHTPWISNSWEEKKNVQYLIHISILFTRWNNMLPILGQIKLLVNITAAAAAKSLQSCSTLCDPTDGSPPGSPVPWIL